MSYLNITGPDNFGSLNISINQTLSEHFIEKFKNRVDFDSIFKYQNISKNFIKDNYSKYFQNTYDSLPLKLFPTK